MKLYILFCIFLFVPFKAYSFYNRDAENELLYSEDCENIANLLNGFGFVISDNKCCGYKYYLLNSDNVQTEVDAIICKNINQKLRITEM